MISRAALLLLGLVGLAASVLVPPSVAPANAVGISISGTVTAADGGLPLQGMQVDLVLQPGEGGGLIDSVLTAADGTYTFTDVPDGTYHVCAEQFWDTAAYYLPTCWGQEGVTVSQPIIVAGAPLPGIDLALGEYASISGSVLWAEDGTGTTHVLDGAKIFLVPVTAVRDVWFGDDPAGTTNSGGDFTVNWVTPGSYLMKIAFDGSSPWLNHEYWDDGLILADAQPVTVTSGQDLVLDPIVLDERALFYGRLAGADRYATAVAVSQAAFPDDNPVVPVVYIANGLNYPDALAAGPAAIAQGGVLLTTHPTSLPDVVRQELIRLQPEKVIVAGGVNSVSAAVFNQIVSAVGPGVVTRLGGATRYETARMIVEDAFDEAYGVYIATGRNYPDALSAGPAAGERRGPVLLVDGLASGLDQATKDLLYALNPDRVYIVGGAAAVGAGIEADVVEYINDRKLDTWDVDWYRFAGVDRYQTSFLINNEAFYRADAAFVAVGTNFADALTGGALAGAWASPLYLTPSTCLMPSVADSMVWNHSNLLVLLGGTAVLSPAVAFQTFCPISWSY